MLISAKYKNDRIVTTHVVKIDGFRDFANKMRKERGNGWTDQRTMRFTARIPEAAIEKYEETHPGFKDLAFGKVKDWKLRDRMIREFLHWQENRQFVWGNV
jgi:hypothetical protein